MDWDDFRYFSVISQTGSVRGTALQLGVNPSTVTRRLDALEQRLGVRLFHRTQTGLEITVEGAEVVHRVARVSDQLRDIESTLKGRDQRLQGGIRVSVPDILPVNILLAELAPFTQRYAGVELELVPGLSTAKGEIDISIRATESPPGEMIGRPLCRVALAVYSSRQFVAEQGVPDEGVAWIECITRGEVMTLYADLREQYFPAARVQVRCDQVFMQHAAISAHLGVGLLPCYLGEADESLVRLQHMPVQSGLMLWLLTHQELRNARRIKVFMDFVRNLFERRESELTGADL